jgi:hypothetical protein
VVFIKTEIIPPLKFRPRLKEMSHHHQSHCTMCVIINFLKIFYLKKLKILGLAVAI